MLSTRNTAHRNELTSRNASLAGPVDGGNYHQISHKRGKSMDCKQCWAYILFFATALLAGCYLSVFIERNNIFGHSKLADSIAINPPVTGRLGARYQEPLSLKSVSMSADSPDSKGCYRSIPEVDRSNHIVPPPVGPVKLVCCQTTQGALNIAVHPTWAPLGAERFLYLVDIKFFSSGIPLFRALKGFLIQFGLSGDPKVQNDFETSAGGRGGLKDDPNWLPEGPSGREIGGVKRFQRGYMAYAGGGENSRGTQLIVALEDNLYLAGGSPWEVPFGHLVMENSFETLDKIYTGYDEKVSQGKIRNRGSEYTKSEFPLLDYMTSCELMAENIPWRYENPNKSPQKNEKESSNAIEN